MLAQAREVGIAGWLGTLVALAWSLPMLCLVFQTRLDPTDEGEISTPESFRGRFTSVTSKA